MDIKQEDEDNDVIETAVFINPRPMHCDSMANSIEQVLKPEPSESSAAQFNEELGIKTECESSTLLTDLNIKREIDTDTSPKSRIKQEYSSMEEQDETALLSDRLVKSEKADGDMCEDRGKPQYIDFRQLSSKNSDSDVDRLNTETVYIKKECDTSFPQESIKHEDITIEKQDTSDPPASTNEVVKKEETISYVDILENMDTDDEDIDTATLQTELDIKDEEIPSDSAVKKKIGGKDQADRSNPERNSFSCHHCNSIFVTKHRLIKHMKVHENKKKVFGCDPSSNDSRGGRICLQCNAIFNRQISLDEHIVKTHPNLISAVTRKIHECTLCAFKTTSSRWFKEHLLKQHLIKKDPNTISSVTNKIHKCTQCSYETTVSSLLKLHLQIHSETRAIYTCLHCKATFKQMFTLDDHILQKHPNFTASVTRKIHECALCAFKTAKSTTFKQHLLKHPETNTTHKFSTCTQCNMTFKSKRSLDIHIVNKHPNLIASVTSKIHKCTKCTFATIAFSRLKSHLSIHEETSAICTPHKCLHCTETFKNKESLDDHIIINHPNFIASVTSKIHECTLCAFKTTRRSTYKDHLLKHPEINTNRKIITCTPCNVTFRRKISLDNHILKKHPNLIASVTRKIHKCSKCTFTTTTSTHLKKHLSTHSETSAIGTLHRCLHCTATFRMKISLDDHIIKKHPNFVSSVTRKIHKCTKCTYATTTSTNLKRHLSTHSETAISHTCLHCTATFRMKISLDDHIVKKHPNFMTSVTSKIHECTLCAFKTTKRFIFKDHLLKHPKINTNPKFTCTQCNATFNRKISLDDHIVKKHPNFIASVTSKIHKCTKCTFATTVSGKLKKHLSTHSETSVIGTLYTCLHCTAAFRFKVSLDDHILKKHPNFIASVTSKIHKCTKCTYETTLRSSLKRHSCNM